MTYKQRGLYVLKGLIIFQKKRKELPQKPKSDMQSLLKPFKDTKTHENLSSSYKLLYKHAKSFTKDTGTSIPIPCAHEVIGAEKIIYILHENLIFLLEYDMLGQSVISAYMA